LLSVSRLRSSQGDGKTLAARNIRLISNRFPRHTEVYVVTGVADGKAEPNHGWRHGLLSQGLLSHGSRADPEGDSVPFAVTRNTEPRRRATSQVGQEVSNLMTQPAMQPDSSASQPRLNLGHFRLETCRVQINGAPSLEDWAGPLLFALWCDRASPWWIGDLLVLGDAAFGEQFSQICRGHISADQLQRYESIARRIPPENRVDSLSWSAHAAVARLSLQEQRMMLARAQQEGWNSEDLRRAVRDFLAAKRGEAIEPKRNKTKQEAPATSEERQPETARPSERERDASDSRESVQAESPSNDSAENPADDSMET
jgi:hypothetical protein